MLAFFQLHWLLNLPPLASAQGKGVDHLLIAIHWLMLILFVGWVSYFVYVLVRFRKSKHPRADYVGFRSHVSNYVEGAVAVVELGLLVGLAIPFWSKTVAQPPPKGKALELKVIGRQFNWTALYPGKDGVFGRQDESLMTADNPLGLDPNDPHGKDDFKVVNDIYVPVNTNLIIHVSSMDVIHSFAIRPMRILQDAIPGMSIPVWFKPDKIGTYLITCSQLCGIGHYSMRGTFHVVSQQDYQKWLDKQEKQAHQAPVSFE